MMILPAQACAWLDKKNLGAERRIDFILGFYPRGRKEVRRKLLCLRWVDTNKPAPWPLAIYPSNVVTRLVKNVLDLRHACLSCYMLLSFRHITIIWVL